MLDKTDSDLQQEAACRDAIASKKEIAPEVTLSSTPPLILNWSLVKFNSFYFNLKRLLVPTAKPAI